jgi:ribose transport system ATP-binding protein
MVSASRASSPLLRVRGLSKTFDGVRVVDDVALEVGSGEAWGLVGANGCGKSTVIKMLSGYHRPDPGAEIVLGDGDASVQLAFVHQDLGLVPTLSVMENLALQQGYVTAAAGRIRWREQRRRARQLLDQYGIAARVDTPVEQLSTADEALLAMARALSTVRDDARAVLVLDEPTSSLAEAEVHRVLDAIRALTATGSSAIFVSHRLNEVLEVTDRVCVMRDGRVAATPVTDGLTHDRLIELMLGRRMDRAMRAARDDVGGGEPLIELRDVGGRRLRHCSLTVRRGEIVGVTGLLGSGKSELGRILSGAQSPTDGVYLLDGQRMTMRGPADAIARGIAYVPPERRTHGTVAGLTARENLTLPALERFWRRGRVQQRSERRETAIWMDRIEIRPPLPEKVMSTFSGGNQQKLVFAKWFRLEPRVLVLDEPTKAVDVGAARDIYELVAASAERGVAVVLLSSEWEDLPQICHRVVVLDRGTPIAELPAAHLTADGIAAACHAGAALA